jgi:DNA-binding YbaB/EbfC family protein
MPKGKGIKPPPGMSGGLAQKLAQMQEEMRRVQDELAEVRLTISAGGDAVQVVIDGQQRLHHIKLSAEALAAAQDDREMLEDLLVAAVNSALEQSQTLAAERLQGLSSGLGLPGLG